MIIGSNIEATEREILAKGVTLETLTDDLTLPNPEYAAVARFGKGKFYRKIPTHICYLKKVDGRYIIPRYYFGEPEGAWGNIGRSLKSEHHIKLRDYQDEFFNEYMLKIKENTGILMEAPCAHGKTSMAIYLSYIRGVQTLIIVPTYYLAKQWKQRIEEFTTASCVVITSKDTEIPTDRDFTVIVADLFTCRVLPDELIKNVGHVILDEAHRMGAETYLPILDELPARYRTALTATFRRADGVHRILKYHFGEHIKMTNRFPRPLVYGVKTSVMLQGVVTKNKPYSAFLEFMEEYYKGFYKLHETKSAIAYDSKENGKLKGILEALLKKKQITKKSYAEIRSCLKRGEEMAYATVESYINEYSARRKEVIRIIEECMEAGRTVLFLSKRKDTLKSLHKYFAKYRPMLIVSETNVRSDEDEEYLQTKCPLIFGVNQLAKEGLDIDRLDTLIIHLPMADTEQAIGRISRICEGKKQPVALYLVDKCPLTYATFAKAKKTFAINADYKGDITLPMLKSVLEN